MPELLDGPVTSKPIIANIFLFGLDGLRFPASCFLDRRAARLYGRQSDVYSREMAPDGQNGAGSDRAGLEPATYGQFRALPC